MKQHLPGLGHSSAAEAAGQDGAGAAASLPEAGALDAQPSGGKEQKLGSRLKGFLGGKKKEGGAGALGVGGLPACLFGGGLPACLFGGLLLRIAPVAPEGSKFAAPCAASMAHHIPPTCHPGAPAGEAAAAPGAQPQEGKRGWGERVRHRLAKMGIGEEAQAVAVDYEPPPTVTQLGPTEAALPGRLGPVAEEASGSFSEGHRPDAGHLGPGAGGGGDAHAHQGGGQAVRRKISGGLQAVGRGLSKVRCDGLPRGELFGWHGLLSRSRWFECPACRRIFQHPHCRTPQLPIAPLVRTCRSRRS